MKNSALTILLFLCIKLISNAQTFQNINRIDAVTQKEVSIESLMGEKGLILFFHNLNCPFAKMYESRIKTLRANYQNKGFAFALINPETGTEADNQKKLRTFIDESGLNMTYLIDEGQEMTQQLNITKIPEVIVLTPDSEGIKISFRGAIDNNPQAEGSVSEKFLERAINQILRGETPSPAQVRASGCNIKRF